VSTIGDWLAEHADLDRRDREVLLCRAAALTRGQILSRPERPLERTVLATLQTWAERRRRGEPVAYILGERDFWALTFAVSPAVLVPRPETELLVEAGIDVLVESRSRPGAGNRGAVPVLELGTGSGAVAIALAVEAEARALAIEVSATDINPQALEVARGNGRRHGADIAWLQSDWFQAVSGRYHLIVSNPPYVAEDDPHLEALAHEPRLALAAGADGLDAIRTLAAAAPGYLDPGGVLLLEHGHDQGAAVRALLAVAGFEDVETLPDLAGLDRVTRARARRRCR